MSKINITDPKQELTKLRQNLNEFYDDENADTYSVEMTREQMGNVIRALSTVDKLLEQDNNGESIASYVQDLSEKDRINSRLSERIDMLNRKVQDIKDDHYMTLMRYESLIGETMPYLKANQ